jgi:hypothetical protein
VGVQRPAATAAWRCRMASLKSRLIATGAVAVLPALLVLAHQASNDDGITTPLLVLSVAMAMPLLIAIAQYRLVSRSLNRIVAASRRLAGGDFSARTGTGHGAAELETAAQAFDAMAESLAARTARLERQNAELDVSLDELASTERELSQARDLADAANRAKSAFLAAMSHELRTPLNSIIGYSEMLIEDVQREGDHRSLSDLRRIHTSGRHLLGLINDILDLSKIEAGRMDIVAERFSVTELIADVAHTIHPSIEQQGNRLEIHCDPMVGHVVSDVARVRQILLNLLSNATKFTHGGRVQLAVERAGASVVFRVTDTGIGMDEAQIARLFEPFVQADPQTSRRYGGTGLGLALSRRLCDLLDADIAASSTPGVGSVFTLRLPARPTTRAAGRTDSTGEHAIATPVGDGPLVLVIDDEQDARDLLRRQLTSEGYRVVTVAGGRAGLRLARELDPALITLDVLMPGMDGWTVLEALKSEPATRDIPVVMCTIVDDERRGFALGATDFLTKPIDRKAFTRVLHDYRCPVPPCRALVVEDDAESREILERVLVKAGWHVETAANGRIGLEYLARQVPSLVLLDLMMPEMDGFEFLENMHRRAEWRDVPVVVVTAKVLSEEDHDRLNGYVEFVAQKGGEAGGLAVSDVTRLLERALDRERRSGRDRRRLRASRHVQLDAGAAPRDEQPTGTARLRSGERRVAADRRTEADRRSNPHGSAGPDSRSDR